MLIIENNMLFTTLHTVVNIIFFASFILYAFKSKLRCNTAWVIFFVSILGVSSGIMSYLVFNLDAKYPNYGVISIVLWIILTISILTILVKNSFSQILFVLFIAVNMYNNLAFFSQMMATMINIDLPYGITAFLINIGLLILFAPLNWFLMIKLYRNVIDLNVPSSKVLWTVPLMMYAIFLIKFVDDYWNNTRPFSLNDVFGLVLWTISTYIVYCIITNVIVHIHNSSKLSERSTMFEKQLEMQKDQYFRLSENIKENAKMRHDFRHHLHTISGFIESNNTEELKKYMDSYTQNYFESDRASICENTAVNIILQHYLTRAEKSGIKVNIKADVPAVLPILDIDLSVVFGNLFENAIEACERQRNDNKFISLYAKPDGNQFLIEIQNSFDSVKKKNGLYLSSKRKGEGIGLQSVMEIAKKGDGILNISTNDNLFTVSLLMNFQ